MPLQAEERSAGNRGPVPTGPRADGRSPTIFPLPYAIWLGLFRLRGWARNDYADARRVAMSIFEPVTLFRRRALYLARRLL